MRGRRLRMGIACAAAVAVVAWAPAGAGASATDQVRAAMASVPDSAGYRYAAKDDHGVGLDSLKVLQVGGSYIGVHHAWVDGRFEVRVARSQNLLDWTHSSTLAANSSQPTIAALAEGGYVLAWERSSGPALQVSEGVDKLLRPAPPAQRLGRSTVRVEIRHYSSLPRLLAGQADRAFVAPLSLSPTAEGTPSIVGASLPLGGVGSRIELGLHYFADLNGDSYPDADRQATAVLEDFARWRAADAPDINAAFTSAGSRHAGFARPPAGNIGDRDHVVLGGERIDVHEAQYHRRDFSSWRLFLLDPLDLVLSPLTVDTHGGSASLGNPAVTPVELPDGRPGLFMSAFVFAEGAAPGEAGQLLWLREL